MTTVTDLLSYSESGSLWPDSKRDALRGCIIGGALRHHLKICERCIDPDNWFAQDIGARVRFWSNLLLLLERRLHCSIGSVAHTYRRRDPGVLSWLYIRGFQAPELHLFFLIQILFHYVQGSKWILHCTSGQVKFINTTSIIGGRLFSTEENFSS